MVFDTAVAALRAGGHEVDALPLYASGFRAAMSTEERRAYHEDEPIVEDQVREHAELVRAAERAGVDAVVATGFEAAGHIGHKQVHSMILIPACVDAVDIPVIAAGGIADGRSLVAALGLGAQLGYIGTRFLATTECEYSEANKQHVVDMPDTGSRVVTGFFGPCRHLENPFLDVVEDVNNSDVSERERLRVEGEGLRAGPIRGDREHGFMIGGMSAGRINEILPAAEVVRQIVAEAEETIGRLASLTR